MPKRQRFQKIYNRQRKTKRPVRITGARAEPLDSLRATIDQMPRAVSLDDLLDRTITTLHQMMGNSVTAVMQLLPDGVTLYGRSVQSTRPYPGAQTTAESWAAADGCGETSTPLDAKVDVDANLADGTDAAETSVAAWSGCQSGAMVQLWTTPGGGHVPRLSPSFPDLVMDFLVDNPKA